MTPDEQVIWPALANLFFLDTEHEPYVFQSTAQLLKDRGWSRLQVEQTLIERVAPVAGANLGYLIFPIVAGEWAGFDADWLNERIDRLQRRRALSPRWHFFLSDLCCRRMLKRLEWERLLDLLA